ncbi:hypothetical protein EVAR_70282_1 [Eumeta japonica]|uniref:Uncharacterized protein n=1 Tax=Eumeta variegata TaxID=151549 RepID=A0A4C2A8U5_EUMVA|nr:hypothetical protein EVAR_70282_1 [Eumeta japonica]
MDSSPYPQREVYVHNRQQEQAYGYQPKPNVPPGYRGQNHLDLYLIMIAVVEVRPHILRTVELERGPVSKSYQPSPQTYTQPQQKPASVTIFKDNFQGPTQGYSFTPTNQPIQQSYQGRQDGTRSVWAQDQNKLQLAYGKSSTLSYDKSVYNEDRKFSHHSAENQQTRGLLKTPTNYDQPKYAHTSQIARMSPPRRASSPMRRISPDKRLISPQGRQDLRKMSPSRKVSPRRRTSPSRRSPPRKSPTANRRLLSPPPRRSSPPRYSPRSYYEDTEKYDTRSSGPSAPQLRHRISTQVVMDQVRLRIVLHFRQSQVLASHETNLSSRFSNRTRHTRHAPENKYQSGAKSAYPRDSSVEREIRHAPENKYQQGTKSTYRQVSPIERSTNKHIPENKYQHFDILSVKEIHHSTSSAPLKRSRSPIRRNRTPPRRSPRKQSPSHRIWAGDRQSSPVARCPPSPPTWTDQPRTEKQPNVWQRSEELKQRDYHQKSEEDWKKSTAFVGSRDKYEERSDFARRSEYSYREEDDRERHGFKHKAVDRSEQVVKHHEDYAKHPDVYSKHQETYNKYPEQFSKRSEPFNKNQEHLYKRHEQLAGRHRQFSGEHGQFSSHPEPSQKRNLLHHKHQGSFLERREPLLKYQETVLKYQEPLLKYEESVPKRQEPLLKYTDQAKKRQDSYSKPLEQFTRRQERQETFPMRQDQYAERRDDRFIRSEENHKQSEGYRYSSDNKRIDSCLGHFDNAPRYEANKAAQKPETGFTELTKRAQDWAQGIGQYNNPKIAPHEEKKELPMDPQLRQKAINVITRKILARHNVKMKDERQKKISICLRKMIEKRVNNIICKKNMNLLEIQHKFRLTYSIQDEEKMYFDAVAVYPPKRHNEDSGEPLQKVAKGDDHDIDKQGWDVDVYSDDRLESSSIELTMMDDFSAISTVEADTIRQFLVSKIFDATASSASNGWVPNFIMRGLSSLCRYEVETNDRLSKIWLEQFDFSDLGGIHIVVYNKEELWYERVLWLPGHSACKMLSP